MSKESAHKDWWDSNFAEGLALLAVSILLFSFLWRVPNRDLAVLSQLERLSFDLQMEFLRATHSRPAAVEPVLIGIDESAEDAFEEPIALWHKHFAKTLDALVLAKPKLVGVDVQLPSRSFDNIRAGLDIAFLTSLHRIKQNVPFVVVHTLDRRGDLAQIHHTYHKTLGDESFALDKVLEDPDRMARRYNEREVVSEGSLDPLAGHIARLFGRPVQAGFIDYSVGGMIDYIPIQNVIGWLNDGEVVELRRRFEGRVVLIGSVTRGQDRWKLPVPLSNWERNVRGELQLEQPGVIVHYQTLRSLLGDGLIRPIPDWLKWATCGAILLIVFLPSSRYLYWGLLLVIPLMIGVSLLLINTRLLIPAVTFIAVYWIAVLVGAAADGAHTLLEKNRLKGSFYGSVSPAVLQEILAGNLESGVNAKSADVCVMFTDIRGFTGLSETLPPEKVTDLLTRYFDRMVDCVHRHNGTMDKFMGDGMMVLFGAPQKVGNPCVEAVSCGFEMIEQLKTLNAEFASEGLPNLAIGIGINYGKVVVGNIGSSERHNYSAIGDAVNVGSRIEGLTKRLGAPIVFTDSVRENLGEGFVVTDFGEQAIRGHSAKRLWGVSAIPPVSGQ